MKVLCFALFACAFNLLLGYTGLLSFWPRVFLGTAAYVTGHALKVWNCRHWSVCWPAPEQQWCWAG